MKEKLIFVIIVCISSSSIMPGFRHYTQKGKYKLGQPYQINNKWYYPHEDLDYEEVGNASWYGNKEHKKQTASGERFDKNKISGAHPTLPLPSVVKVTNLDNGKSLNIRINDRGPFKDDRIIDVSEKAAYALGMHEKGIAKVQVKLNKQATKKARKLCA